MNKLFRSNGKNLCASCKHAKDKWHDACYCVYYGIIISKGKDKCWGHEPSGKEEYEQDQSTGA